LKGIILHGGHGTRLRPLTHTGPKQLLPIANKPMSQYALEDLRDAGIKDIAIIIGDIYPEKVKEFYGDGQEFGVNITYVYQDKPGGISHAIRLCKEFVGNDRFVVYLGDNILRKGLTDYVKKFESSNVDAMILLCEVDDPSRFGIAEVSDNKVIRTVEKPKEPKSNLAVIGVYFLTPLVFDIIDNLKPSSRGELEITDAIQMILDQNHTLQYDTVSGWWKDTGTPEDIIDANRLVLDSLKNEESHGSNFDGNVILGKNTTISKDSMIKGPVIIGDNCMIERFTSIGQNVSIGNDCKLKNCNIQNSIIMDNCEIDLKISIVNSIIANGSKILNSNDPKKQFLLGERSIIKM